MSAENKEITFYNFPASFYAQKIKIYLLEKGVQFNEQTVNLAANENLEESFLRINPAGTVPVVKHGDHTVTESHDIFLYGEDKFSGTSLLPADKREEVLKLSKDINTVNGNALFFGCLLSDKYSANFKLPPPQKQAMKEMMSADKIKEKYSKKVPTDETTKAAFEKKRDETLKHAAAFNDPAFIEKVLKDLQGMLPHMEEQLEKTHKAHPNEQTYLLSAQPTIADIDLAVLLARIFITGQEETYFSEAKAPNLHRFFKQWQSRPSFQKAVLQQG